ncbi:MAG: hypothetical protein S4CHLAM6_10600 [Chlamydiae bacterium]|nr:hypothetical protein [Chlamydiota bacterium]
MDEEHLVYQLMEKWFEEASVSEKSQEVMKKFLARYHSTVQISGESKEFAGELFTRYLELLRGLNRKPIAFEPYHKMITEPVDFYQFGLDFARPLIDSRVSEYLGEDSLKKITEQLKAKDNVIFFANHQTEIDPQLINLLLEKNHPALGKDIIYVAGDRVISDHLAIPMSLGRHLLCIYSKKHINNPPERKEEKRLHNKKTMQLMSQLLSEGGKCIYVAPSGGRDRPDENGEFHVAPLDPQSVEMFYLMTKRAKHPTHFYPLTLLTYRVLPPPNDVEVELGEERFATYAGIYVSFGKEIDMMNFPGHAPDNKLQHRHARCEYIWSQIADEYQRLNELKDKNEKHL